MGALTLPAAGLLYLDACCLIYRVEQVEPYHTLLGPVFAAAKTGTIGLVTSELSLMECLVKPVHAKDANPPQSEGDWGEEVPLGEGSVGMEGFLKALDKTGYSGPLLVEREVGDQAARVETIRSGIKLLKSLTA